MLCLHDLSADINNVNITLDIGSVINAYKIVWPYPERFRNVVIHPGDFHFLKENFKVIGNLIKE